MMALGWNVLKRATKETVTVRIAEQWKHSLLSFESGHHDLDLKLQGHPSSSSDNIR
jgi:hypothetical protein